MQININKDYRLTSDKYNIVLEQRFINQQMLKENKEDKKATIKGEHYGEEYWSSIGFYPTVEMALQNYFSKQMRTIEGIGIDVLLDRIKEVREDIRGLKIVYERDGQAGEEEEDREDE